MDANQLRELIKGLSEVAQIVSNYHLELKRCGFNDEQALEMAKSFQSDIIRKASGQEE